MRDSALSALREKVNVKVKHLQFGASSSQSINTFCTEPPPHRTRNTQTRPRPTEPNETVELWKKCQKDVWSILAPVSTLLVQEAKRVKTFFSFISCSYWNAFSLVFYWEEPLELAHGLVSFEIWSMDSCSRLWQIITFHTNLFIYNARSSQV